jgi:hypothetical protein
MAGDTCLEFLVISDLPAWWQTSLAATSQTRMMNAMVTHFIPPRPRNYKAGLLFSLLLLPLLCGGEVLRSANEDNGLERWHFIDGDIEIELVQRLPDQTRALFMNHAFSKEVIEELAQSCMFQTIIRNTGKSSTGQVVAIDLTQWRMQYDGKTSGILLKEPLLASWSDADADAAAKLVVRWGMFPTRQEYSPGDYNWGLTAYGIPPGSSFDLFVYWQEGTTSHRGEIRNILCAPDVDRLK